MYKQIQNLIEVSIFYGKQLRIDAEFELQGKYMRWYSYIYGEISGSSKNLV